MAELTSQDKVALAFIYELDEYKALKRWLENERLEIATKLLILPPDNATTIAKFQGQADALKNLHLELKRIHKNQTKLP